MYTFYEDEYEVQYEGRYWNCGGTGVAIIASITKGVDWSAYIGADGSRREEDTCEYTAAYGNKLAEVDARYFFPDIDLPYRH